MKGQGIRWIVIAAAGVTLCTACDRSGEAQRNATAPGASVASSASEPTQSPPPPSSVQTPPPLPQEGPSSGETAQAKDDALRPMTKDEEATNMPRPSQANDHSTLSPPKDENR